MRGGKRTGAGRPRGARNKRSLVSEAFKREIATSGKDPVEYMLGVMKNDKDPNRRLEAAKGAAPYLRAKLTQAEITHHNPDFESDEEAGAKAKSLLANPDAMATFVSYAIAPDLIEKTREALKKHGLTLAPTEGPVTHISKASA